jgi:hypothetical protein
VTWDQIAYVYLAALIVYGVGIVVLIAGFALVYREWRKR